MPRPDAWSGSPDWVVVIGVEEMKRRGGREAGGLKDLREVVDQGARPEFSEFGDFCFPCIEEVKRNAGERCRSQKCAGGIAEVGGLAEGGEAGFVADDDEFLAGGRNKFDATGENFGLCDFLSVSEALKPRPQIVASRREGCGFNCRFIDLGAGRKALQAGGSGFEGAVVANDRVVEIDSDHRNAAVTTFMIPAESIPQ